MQHSPPVRPRRWFVRHLPDVCLAAALLLVLALSLRGDAPGRTDWVDAAREAVSGQLGERVPGPAVAGVPERPAAAPPEPG